jgi:hypothetical protein
MNRSSREQWPDDATLVAFADGMLAAEEASDVELFLAESADARRFVEFLRSSGDLAKGAFDDALDVPQSDAKLAALIMGSAEATRPAETGSVVSLPLRQDRPALVSRFALPMAAAIALLLGGVGGYEFGRRGSGVEQVANGGVAVGPVAGGTVLAKLLDEKPSGEPLSVEGTRARDFMVVASFRDAKGRICREFEVLVAETGGPVTAGIACRRESGAWHVEGAAQMAKAPEPSSQDFSPASGDDVAAIEGLLKAIGAKPALSKEDEDALLRKKWQ